MLVRFQSLISGDGGVSKIMTIRQQVVIHRTRSSSRSDLVAELHDAGPCPILLDHLAAANGVPMHEAWSQSLGVWNDAFIIIG